MLESPTKLNPNPALNSAKENKRIAVISFHTCPLAFQEGKESGGMNIYVLELYKQLALQGWQVDIFTRSQELLTNKVVEFQPNLRVIHIVAGPEQVLHKKDLLQYTTEFADNLALFHQQPQEKQRPYHLVHGHYYMSAMVISHLKNSLFASLPIFFTYHTLGLLKNLVARNEDEMESWERIAEELEVGRYANYIIAPSEAEREYLEGLYGIERDKIVVLPPGVDLDRFQPIARDVARQKVGAPQNQRIILFAGRLEPLKGIDVLLYSAKVLITKYHEFDKLAVWIVGGEKNAPTAELKRLEKVAKLLQIEANVKFLGKQSQDDLPNFYNASEAVVLASHYESFGMVASEALACGVPVITTNVAGVSQMLDRQHPHLITTVQNPLLLAKQLYNILTGVHQHSRVLLRSVVGELSWANLAKKLAVLYERSL